MDALPTFKAAEHIPIQQLNPRLGAASSTRYIHGIVALTWPYLSLKPALTLLVAEPDFRLRDQRGQVRIQFTQSSAEAVAAKNLSVGDEITLSLEGVQWLEREDGPVATPGTDVGWELRFDERAVLEVRHGDGSVSDIDINGISNSDEDQANLARLARSRPQTPNPVQTQDQAPSRPRLPSDEWQSPAFVGRAKLVTSSQGTYTRSSFADGNVLPSSHRSKRMKFGKGSGEWAFLEEIAPPVESLQNDSLEKSPKTHADPPTPPSNYGDAPVVIAETQDERPGQSPGSTDSVEHFAERAFVFQTDDTEQPNDLTRVTDSTSAQYDCPCTPSDNGVPSAPALQRASSATDVSRQRDQPIPTSESAAIVSPRTRVETSPTIIADNQKVVQGRLCVSDAQGEVSPQLYQQTGTFRDSGVRTGSDTDGGIDVKVGQRSESSLFVQGRRRTESDSPLIHLQADFGLRSSDETATDRQLELLRESRMSDIWIHSHDGDLRDGQDFATRVGEGEVYDFGQRSPRMAEASLSSVSLAAMDIPAELTPWFTIKGGKTPGSDHLEDQGTEVALTAREGSLLSQNSFTSQRDPLPESDVSQDVAAIPEELAMWFSAGSRRRRKAFAGETNHSQTREVRTSWRPVPAVLSESGAAASNEAVEPATTLPMDNSPLFSAARHTCIDASQLGDEFTKGDESLRLQAKTLEDSPRDPDRLARPVSIRRKLFSKARPAASTAVDFGVFSTSEPRPPATGFWTRHAYFTPLGALAEHFSSVVDVFGVCTVASATMRAKYGPKDYAMTVRLVDGSSVADPPLVQIFRPFRQAMPRASEGDAVMLRSFRVISSKRNFALISTAESAWAVWRAASTASEPPEIRGPPVEYADNEVRHAHALLAWSRQLSRSNAEPNSVARD